MNARRTHPAGFTLLELMISIAIVLILMLGINFVFSTTSRTVGQGMALTSVSREMRAARKVFESDLASAVPAAEMPALIIHNQAIDAFRDRQDQLSDYDGSAQTFDVDGDQANGDEYDLGPLDTPTFPGMYNYRRHRVDRISFFARSGADPFTRQTGDNTTYVGAETSNEAWIQYGLLRVAENNDQARFWKPGAGTQQTNPNNFFASQWMLGRRRILLHDDASLTNSVFHTGTVAGQYGINFGAPSYFKNGATSGAWNRQVQMPYGTAAPWRIEESRLDQVNGSIANFLAAITPLTNSWWEDVDIAEASRRYDQAVPGGGPFFNYLSWAKPFVSKAGFGTGTFANQMSLQTREAALTTPIFIKGATQVVVEFGGDFFEQLPGEPLGVLDYDEIAPGETRVRWYGIDRDMDGNGTINVGAGDVTTLTAHEGSSGTSRYSGNAAGVFEHHNATLPGSATVWAWKAAAPIAGAGTAPVGGDPVAGTPGTQGDWQYVRPSYIRITIEILDPNGRLNDGQRIELIYPIKAVTQ